ncbi:MAG: hypothetical protein GX799_04350 [Crenarchaeota archaeon]|nr:hypothetical protein [Thermoproteota archaeon]
MESKEPAQEGILSDNAYGLIVQLTEENQSLWRIKTYYKKDAGGDQEVMEFWTFLEDKREYIKKLTELLEKRIKS